jgi:hypothetical protein
MGKAIEINLIPAAECAGLIEHVTEVFRGSGFHRPHMPGLAARAKQRIGSGSRQQRGSFLLEQMFYPSAIGGARFETPKIMADQGSIRRRGLRLSSTTFSVPFSSPTPDRKAVGKSQLVVNKPTGLRGIESHPREPELCGEVECGRRDGFSAAISAAVRMDEHHPQPGTCSHVGHDGRGGDDFAGYPHAKTSLMMKLEKPEPILFQLVPVRQSAQVEQGTDLRNYRAGNAVCRNELFARHGLSSAPVILDGRSWLSCRRPAPEVGPSQQPSGQADEQGAEKDSRTPGKGVRNQQEQADEDPVEHGHLSDEDRLLVHLLLVWLLCRAQGAFHSGEKFIRFLLAF